MLHQVNWQNLIKDLLINDLIETTKNNLSWLDKFQLPVYLFTFLISKQIRGQLAYRYPRTIRMSNKFQIYIITIKYWTSLQNFYSCHFIKQIVIEIYENISLIHRIRFFTNPSSAIICRYCTRLKTLLFSMVLFHFSCFSSDQSTLFLFMV